ncbi:MAG: NAD-dependent epimerase/dehydratase family protein [Syntrophothermus sp.]
MRVFLAGASGVIGRRLVPLLVADGHRVAGMTRTPAKAGMLGELGAEPVVADVYDAAGLRDAVVAHAADLVMHQLTDLPDELERIPEMGAANSRIRTEGTRNLLAAAEAAGAPRFLAQSIAWRLEGGAHRPVEEHEAMVLGAGGVVVRYGQFWGPGTYHEEDPGDSCRVQIDEAARRTLELLEAPSGIFTVVDR